MFGALAGAAIATVAFWVVTIIAANYGQGLVERRGVKPYDATFAYYRLQWGAIGIGAALATAVLDFQEEYLLHVRWWAVTGLAAAAVALTYAWCRLGRWPVTSVRAGKDLQLLPNFSYRLFLDYDKPTLNAAGNAAMERHRARKRRWARRKDEEAKRCQAAERFPGPWTQGR